jgi:hypothetical protein
MMHTRSDESWNASRSVDTTQTRWPASSAMRDSVPMTSSASLPSTRTLR